MSQLPPQEQKPEAQASVSPFSETLIAAEFSALKEEILKLTEIQFQLIIVALSAFGTLFTVGLQIKSAPVLLIYPILTLILSTIWINHAYHIDRIGSYIQYVIEPRVGTRNIGWENASRSKLPPHAFIAFWLSRWAFILTQLIALAAGIALTLSTMNLTNILLIVLAAASTGASIYVFIHTSRVQGKGKRLGEVKAV